MAKDLERMSFKELQELEQKVQKAKSSVHNRSRSALLQKLESIAATLRSHPVAELLDCGIDV